MSTAVERLKGLDSRAKVFIVLAVVLAVAAATGFLRSDRDIEIEQAEAIEIARPLIDFEPTKEEARIIRQGPRLRPVWAVAFSIPEEANPREFVRRTTIELDARTGEIIRVTGGDSEPDSG